MARYRHLPTEIDAEQWDGADAAKIRAIAPGGCFHPVEPGGRQDDPDRTAEVYDRLHGTWIGVRDGQWVARGTEGECWPIKDEVFRRTYEPVPEGPQPPRPRIVCLCGSTRFGEAFRDANLSETLAGRIVLSIGCDFKTDGDLAAAGALGKDPEAVKRDLDELHKRKIDIADEVLVVSRDGYWGDSTAGEIAYAVARGKPVRFAEDAARERAVARGLLSGTASVRTAGGEDHEARPQPSAASGLSGLVRDMLQAFPDTADEQEWRDRAGALGVRDPCGRPYRAWTEEDLGCADDCGEASF